MLSKLIVRPYSQSQLAIRRQIIQETLLTPLLPPLRFPVIQHSIRKLIHGWKQASVTCYTHKNVLIGIEILELHYAFLCSRRINIPSANLLCHLVEGASLETFGITVAVLEDATWAGRAKTSVQWNRGGDN